MVLGAVELAVSVVLAAIIIGYPLSQMPGWVPGQPEQQAVQHPVAAQRQTRQQAERSQASEQGSPYSTIAEGQLVASHIAQLKAMRAELSNTMNALNKKAKSSASASRRWDRIWADRRARYRRRYAAVRAHNASERRRYAASETERANSDGKLVVVRTYTPRYWAYPSSPKKPGRLKVSVASETARLSKLQKRIDALESTIASESPTAQSFESVYKALSATAQTLGATVDGATRVARTVVVKRGAKGRVVDGSRLSKVNQGALDDPFVALERSYSDALAAAGLSAEQVATETVDVQ